MKKSRIAVVGVGLIGKAHLEIICENSELELHSIVDPSNDAKLLAKLKGLPWHEDLSSIFGADRPDGIVLATPNQLHKSQAIDCINAGIPILLEKPIATNISDAKAIVRASNEKNINVLIGHHRAHSPIISTAKKIIDSGCLGPLTLISGYATFYKPASYFKEAPWRSEIGGGPILINLIHEIHNFRVLCGEIESVQAIVSSAIRGYPVEDTAVINFRFKNGALGNFMLSDTTSSARSWEHTSGENKAYPQSDDEDCYVVGGVNGSLAIPSMKIKNYSGAQEPSWWLPMSSHIHSFDREDPLVLQMAHFGRVIAGKEMPLVSAEDGLENLRIIDAIARAVASGGTINL